MKDPLLSVVIPCKNEEEYIGRTLQSLADQTYDMSDVPVIIADAESTDRTLKLISEYQERCDFNIHVINGGYPPEGRNSGARYSNSKYILFLDADIELGEANCLERIIHMAEKEELDLVSTFIKCREANLYDLVFWSIHALTCRLTSIIGPFAAGMFIFIRRDTFDKLGGFNENMILGDDWELTRMITKKKFRVADTFIWTTNRRFKQQGYIKTISQYIQVAFSRSYRMRDHSDYMKVQF